MARKKHAENGKAKRYEGRLKTVCAIQGRDELRGFLRDVAPGLCSLVESALIGGESESREAAMWVAQDLQRLVEAAAAALGGSDVKLEVDDRPGMAELVDFKRLIMLDREFAMPASQPAREAIGARFAEVIRDLAADTSRHSTSAEARA
jgi:hypothetical protein